MMFALLCIQLAYDMRFVPPRCSQVVIITHAYEQRCGVRYLTNGLKVRILQQKHLLNGSITHTNHNTRSTTFHDDRFTCKTPSPPLWEALDSSGTSS